jgi:protein-tyrosine phosphatase
MDLTKTVGYVPGFAPELNLRELGGLPTDDGRTVRRGLFYRGSALVGLGQRERALVDGMGLRYVLDLRAAGEASGNEDYLAEGTDYQRIGGMRFDDGSEVDFSPEAIARFEEMDPQLFEDGSFMKRLYVGMAFGNPAVHALVEHVAAGEVPVYFHCTAGKDRTGVSALVICLLLGVTREAIMEDFLLTNEYRRSIIESVADRMPPDTPPELIERWQKANGVNASDLLAVMAAIDERCGGVEAYFEQEFGIDGQTLAALRDRYLA